MFLIRVIPLSRGITKEELSYWSVCTYPEGSLVTISLRSSDVRGLVVSCEPIANTRQEVRSQTFALKKIRKQRALPLFSAAFIQAATKAAERHATTTGATIFSYTPNALLDEEVLARVRPTTKPKFQGYVIPRLFQAPFHTRVEFYRTAVREAFAAGGSVYLLAPTIAEAERIYEPLAHGIEGYAHLVTSGMSKTKQRTTLTTLLDEEHPVLVVMTPSFLALPRHDLATVILEREASPLYRMHTRPHIDTRTLAHELAAALGGQFYRADLPLSIESIYLRDTGEYEEVVSGHHRTVFESKAELVTAKNAERGNKPFTALGPVLTEKLRDNYRAGQSTFLYVARRGLSPITLCRDCGTTVVCNDCDASVVLHKGNEENYFLCHSCGALRHARERCVVCRSWRLEAFGIGTELVERELRERAPDATILTLSSDTARTHRAASRIAQTFADTPGALLIGTELALPYLSRKVPLSAVVSLDALLSLPTWSMYERIASTLTRIREWTEHECIVQTRRPEAGILALALEGNFSTFYKNELKERKSFGYPPFTTIIKVTAIGTEETVTEQLALAQQVLAPFELIPFHRLLRAPKGNLMLHGFVRIRRETWPEPSLLERLRALPPSLMIEIDPENVL